MRKTWKTRGIALALCLCFCSAATGAADYPIARSETVYVDLDPYGTPTSVISSVYITNAAGAETVTDHTTLYDVKNVLSNEKPQQTGETLTFKADGEDVCYQGVSDAQPPFSVGIAYTLDGAPIDAAALAGKSGRLKITVTTQNHSRATRLVDGVETELYTPFSIVCMFTLNERCSFIQSTGKINAAAGNVSVLGILHPGLRESLGVEKADMLKDTLTIETQVKDFEMEGATFLALTGVLNEDDLSSVDDVQELIDGIDKLSDATDELYDGVRDFDDGLREYADGMKEFTDGLQEFKDGFSEYAGGVIKVSDGAKKLATSTKDLAKGANELQSGIDTLAGKLQSGVVDSSGAISQSRVAALATDVATQLVRAGKIPPAEVATWAPVVAQAIGTALKEQGALTEAALKKTVAGLTAALTELSKGAGKLSDGTEILYNGLVEYACGTVDLVGATGKVQDGILDLQAGADELYDGALELGDASKELLDGVGEMREDGVDKMADETADLSVSLSRKDALLALSDAYTSFSCTDPTVSGSVQFVLTTKSIAMEKPIPTPTPEAQVEAEGGSSWLGRLWETVKGWFGG